MHKNQPAFSTESSSTFSTLSFYLFTGVALVAQFLLHQKAGLSFPIPWPDEVHFLWQARAFCLDNSLFTPVLNTDRIIMWMPPGYMILTGCYFKLVGVSLEAARWLSFVGICALFVLLLRYLVSHGHKWFTVIFTSLFFINAFFIASGNVARMEGMLLVLVVAGYLFIVNNRFLVGLCLLALTPLLHFNGLFFCVGGAALIWYRSSREAWRKQFSITSIILLVIVIIAWIAYAVFIAKQWDSFVQDMQFQFQRKAARDIWRILLRREHITIFILLVIGGMYAYKSKLRSLELLFLAVPAWLVWLFGQEMWYEVIRSVAYLCITLFAIHCWFHLITRDVINRRPLIMALASLIFLVYLARGDYRSDQIENMFHYPDRMELSTMKFADPMPYVTDKDRIVVETLLREYAKDNSSLKVEFEPIGDAFLFLGLHDNHELELQSPLFQKRQSDMLVVHWSRRLPEWWKFNDSALARAGVTRDSTQYIRYSHDSTEQWFFVPMSNTMRTKL